MALLYGNRLDNLLTGSFGNDTIGGLGGNDTIDGGGSALWYVDKDYVDTAWYSGVLAGYRFSADAEGRLVVTDTNAADGSDGVDTLSRIERLTFGNAALALGPAQFRVNTTTAGDQASPSVAALPDGGFVMSWSGPAAPGSNFRDAFVQRFDASGIPLGPETRVFSTDIPTVLSTDVASFGNGRTVVAFQGAFEEVLSSPSYFIGLRLYGPTGAQESEVIAGASAGPNEDAESPAVAPLGPNGFLLAFHFRTAPDFPNWTVQVARFLDGGTLATEVLEVSAPASGFNNSPDATGVAGVGSVVVWQGPDADSTGIFAQRFDGSGELAGSRFAVNTVTTDQQLSPSVAMLEDGRFMVAWMSFDGTSTADIVARIYNANGTPAGAQFLVDGASPNIPQVNPSVAAMDDGTFMVAWTDYSFSAVPSADVVARRFEADGDPIGDAFRVNGPTANDQTGVRIAGLAGGGLAAAWQDAANPASGVDISAARFDANGVRAPFITGSAAADVINLGGTQTLMVDGGNGNDAVNGSSAIDFLQGGSGNDTLNGGDGGDHLMGGAGIDVLNGDDGTDVLDGGEGADRLTGGAGDDEYVVDNSGDLITEIATGGNDTVLSSITLSLLPTLENLVLTGTGNINATGNSSGNLLAGNSGNNRLDGGTGADLMSGGAGNDTFVVDNEIDAVGESAFSGLDTVITTVTYTLPDYVENLTLSGTAAINGVGNDLANSMIGNGLANLLVGEAGSDSIVGGGGNDTIDGLQGDDVMTGGLGNDQLRGLDGADKFVFDAALSATGNLDTVEDFTPGQDEMQLSKTVFLALGTPGVPLDASQFREGAGFTSGATPQHRIVYNTDTGELYYDRDGNGAAASVKFAVLTGAPDIDSSAFFVTN